MTVSTSSNFFKNCYADSITYREYIILTGTNTQIDVKTEMYQTAYKDTHFIGTFNLGYVKFTTQNDIQFRNKEFEFYKEVNGESLKIGNFIVTEIVDNDTNEEVTVTAYDYGLKFAKPYTSSLNYESGEITLFQVLQECCQQCDVVLENESITNGDFIVENNQFVNNETFGDVVSAIAFISGNFATITNQNKLRLVFQNTNNGFSPVIFDYIDLDDKRDTRPITCLSIGTSQVKGQGAEIKDQSLIDEYGENWLIINDVPFAYTLEKRERLKTAIFNKVKGFGYSSFKSEYSFMPFLELGDKVVFINKAGQRIESIVLRITSNYDNMIIEAPSITDASVEYENPKNAYDMARRAEVIADQNAIQISYITTKTEDIEDNLNNQYYTKTTIDTMIQNTESGVTNNFTQVGGNNLLRNTGLWFEIEPSSDVNVYPSSTLYPSGSLFFETNKNYEFWDGFAVRNSNDDAINNNSILLQSGNFSQKIDVPNGDYTLSFKYIKHNPLANANVVINGNSYSLDSETLKEFYTGEFDSESNEYITLPLKVTSRYIQLTFTCNTNNAVEVYDIMCNKGLSRAVYTQNENETTTDTVNISQGITITSTNMETIFKANANGIRILTLSNQVVAYFTDKGLNTKEAVIEDEANICGTLVKEVGDQTWFTRL